MTPEKLRPSGPLAKIRRLLRTAFATTPDRSTPEGRSQDRYRRAALTSLTLIAARIANILTGLVTIPIVLDYLGKDLFGVWMLVVGFVSFLQFTDLGVGHGLQNSLIQCLGSQDSQSPRFLIGGAYLLMLLLFAVLILFAWVLPATGIAFLFRIPEHLRGTLETTIQAFLIVFGLGLPAGLLQRICDAHQRGYWANLLLLIGRVTGFIGVVVGVMLQVSLPVLVAIYVGAPFFFLGIGTLVAFVKVPTIRPDLSGVTRSHMRQLVSIGGQMFGIRLLFSGLVNLPELIIANQIGVAAVGSISVTRKLIGAANLVTMSVNNSLWAAYGEAAHRGEWEWIRRTLQRTLAITLGIYLPILLVMLVAGRTIIIWWTGDVSVTPTLGLLAACALFSLVQAIRSVFAPFIFGINHLRLQLVGGAVALALASVAALLLAPVLGATGVMACFAVLGMGLFMVFTLLETRAILRRSPEDPASHQ